MQGLAGWYPTAPTDIEVVNVSVQDVQRNPADAQDAQDWADWHGADWIDVADPNETWIAVWQNSNSSYYVAQSYTVIDTSGVIVYRGEGKTNSTLNDLKNAATNAQ